MAYINGEQIAFSPKLVQDAIGVVVDQIYNPKSANAQSGKAVAQAIGSISTDDCIKKPETLSQDHAQIPVVTPVNTTQYLNVAHGSLEISGDDDIPTASAVKEYVQNSGAVDTQYNPVSENAQSGKAVAQAIGGILKTTKYGQAIDLTDISPIEHNIECKALSKNIVPPTVASLSNWDNSKKGGNHYYFKISLEPNVTYSFAAAGDGRTSNYQYLYVDEINTKTLAENPVAKLYQGNQKWDEVTFTTKEGCDYCLYYYGTDFFYTNFQIIIGSGASVRPYDYCDNFSYIMVDIYINGAYQDTIYPNADGTISLPYSQGVELYTSQNADIKVVYNRDIAKAFEELQNAIISLGGNV